MLENKLEDMGTNFTPIQRYWKYWDGWATVYSHLSQPGVPISKKCTIRMNRELVIATKARPIGPAPIAGSSI